MIKRLCFLFLTIIIAFSCTGCWDYQSISNAVIISGIAIDWDAQRNTYIVTFEVVKLLSSGSESKLEAQSVDGFGDSISDAITSASGKLGGIPTLKHARLLVFGEEYARRGIASFIESAVSATDFQRSMNIAVVRNAAGAQLLRQSPQISSSEASELADLIEGSSAAYSTAVSTLPYVFNNSMSQKDNINIMPCFSFKADSGEQKPTMDGCGIFKSDKLVGYLDSEETKVYRFIKNKVEHGRLANKKQPANQGYVVAKITGANTKVTAADNPPQVELNSKVILNVSEVNHYFVDLFNKDAKAELELQFAQTLTQSIESLIAKSQFELGCDLFSFSRELRRAAPTYWQEVEGDWSAAYKQLKVTVNAQAEIQQSGLMQSSREGTTSDEE